MGNMPSRYATDWPTIRDQVSPEEWQARLDLAACYRLVDAYGMTDMIYNHITLRIPGTEHLLINLYLTRKRIEEPHVLSWGLAPRFSVNMASVSGHVALKLPSCFCRG